MTPWTCAVPRTAFSKNCPPTNTAAIERDLTGELPPSALLFDRENEQCEQGRSHDDDTTRGDPVGVPTAITTPIRGHDDLVLGRVLTSTATSSVAGIKAFSDIAMPTNVKTNGHAATIPAATNDTHSGASGSSRRERSRASAAVTTASTAFVIRAPRKNAVAAWVTAATGVSSSEYPAKYVPPFRPYPDTM